MQPQDKQTKISFSTKAACLGFIAYLLFVAVIFAVFWYGY